MPEKEKGRVSRRFRQFLRVCPRGDCAHPSHAPPQYGGQLCHCAPFAPCVSWQQGHLLCRGGQQADRRLRGMAPEKGDMQGHLVLLHALFACCLQQGGGAGAYGAERTFRQCVYGHFPYPETFDREGGHQQAACRAGEARFVYATGARCVPVLLLCLRHAFCGCGFPEEIADKGRHPCVSPAQDRPGGANKAGAVHAGDKQPLPVGRQRLCVPFSYFAGRRYGVQGVQTQVLLL